ncbi:MAG: hypothetical protein ACM3ZC_15395 [Bacteroidota bacterium]
MRKILVVLFLTVAMVFAIGGLTIAAPVTAGEAGSVFAFGEYAPGILFAPVNCFTVGVGYSVSDSLALGTEVQLIEGEMLFGGFAGLSLDAISVNGEFLYFDSTILGKVAGLYSFDLDPVKVGVGGGAFLLPGESAFFLEGSASMAAGDNLSIYGSLDYIFDAWTTFKAGAVISF